MTIRSEILDILAKSERPLTAQQIFEGASEALTKQQIATNLYVMKQERLIEPAGKTDGNGTPPVNLWRIARGGALASPKVRGRVKRPHHKKRKHKVQPKTAKRTQRPRRIVLAKLESTYGIDQAPQAATLLRAAGLKPAIRWALASDGACVLLGTDIEIAKPAARALIEFVRVLDKAEA